ncbi:hypothetical protein DNTS_013485 [Danionella cerebrum]|uniref:Fibronectin type-III domain-containing protein n=1 Tax=Danionella cerebrum TaxID=2873325 RepID=A0A553RN15_9TELE|nr:hypothetical protein DNTS_013485 [Danionella translucida]
MSSTCCPAPCSKESALSWLLCSNIDHVSSALETLVDLLQEDRNEFVERFLQHSKPEQCMDVLRKLLRPSASGLSSTADCLLSVLLENECLVLRLQMENKTDLMFDLAQMLTGKQADVVRSATGAMASLVESAPGRKWFLQILRVFSEVLEHLSILLESRCGDTVNSAALVFARLSISEESCENFLSHSSSSETFRRLAMCLSSSHKDTAMNAAFAVGRLCGSRLATRILREAKKHHVVSRLQALLSIDAGVDVCQTACFALSCFANNENAHSLLMESSSIPALLNALLQLLQSTDPNTLWFAAMTIRMLLSRPSGVLPIRRHHPLHQQLKLLSVSPSALPELQEEVSTCLRKLELLPKPEPVMVSNLSSETCKVTWEKWDVGNGLEVTYSLFDRDALVYHGFSREVTVPVSRKPLSLQLSLSTSDGNISPLSEPVSVSPGQLHPTAKPAEDQSVDLTEPHSVPKSGLSPDTCHQRNVSPVQTGSLGGETELKMAENLDHAPSALTVTALGHNELQMNWDAPVAPLGHLFKYELSLNGCVVYLGRERTHTAHQLFSDTVYMCVVTAITSQGRWQSRPVTKKMPKDEHMHTNRFQTSPERYTGSPAVKAMVKKSGAVFNSKTHSVPHEPTRIELTRDSQRTKPIQKHSRKETQPPSDTSKTVPNQDQCEVTCQAKSLPSSPEELSHSRGRSMPAKLKHKNFERKVPSNRRKLPCNTKQTSEDVRLLQSVSFNWSNLECVKQRQKSKKEV